MVFMLLFYGAYVVAASVFIVPRHGESWHTSAFTPSSSAALLAVVAGGFGVAADLVLFFLPLYFVYKQHLERRKQFGVFVLLVVGLL
jgi:hypothetical protein